MPTRPAATKTKKAEETRRRIFEAALSLLRRHGYEKTTMRAIAEEAGTSVGLAYRYFAKKEDLVLELYRRSCVAFEERVAALPRAPLSERFLAAMREKLALVEPYRPVFAAVFATTMNPRSQAFALGEEAADIRAHVIAAWRVVIDGSTDAAELPRPEDLATMLFVAQLAILFFWMNDGSAERASTTRLVALAAGAIHSGLGFLYLDETGAMARDLVALLSPVFLAGRDGPT